LATAKKAAAKTARAPDISALDEDGNPVDWWFIYKVPKLSPGTGTDEASGYEYVYFDSSIDKRKNGMVAKSPYRLDQGSGALNRTLDAVFKNRSKAAASTGWILYNDELPLSEKRPDSSALGHTKGVIVFDTKSETAFWMLHSWPKFADIKTGHEPTPQYGQTYLCLSLSLDTARKIAAQMATHQEPQTYYSRAADLPETDPLYLLTQPLPAKQVPDANVINLKSRAGMKFKVMAKNREWNQDFWNGFVGPTLGEDMDDETWIRGPIPPIADTDGIHKTFDIKYINLGPLGAHWAWPETHDHAKWGITVKSTWVCVGDINRMISQRKRGGGTVAFQNETLWRALSKAGLLLAPPGHSRTQAHALIEKTHVHRMLDHEAPHPASTFVLNHKTKFPVPVKQGSGKKKTA
jgi:deoxyribonuclease-2